MDTFRHFYLIPLLLITATTSCQKGAAANSTGTKTILNIDYKWDPRTKLCFAHTRQYTSEAALAHVPCTEAVLRLVNGH